MELLDKELAPFCSKLQKYFTRVSEVTFEPPSVEKMAAMENGFTDSNVPILDILGHCELKFRAQAHCGYGDAILFTVNFEKKQSYQNRRELKNLIGICAYPVKMWKR